MNRSSTSMLCLLVLSGCNSPPLYHKRAREFLQERNVDPGLASRLIEIKPLSPEEAQQLSAFDNTAVLHFLGSNPSIPESLIEKLARHPSDEVKTGVAANPSAPLQLLLSLRTPGTYTTLNCYLARNPRLPREVIDEMYRRREASLADLALNPNCPPAIMVSIAKEGNETDRAWLAKNPNLPAEIMSQLEHDESELVRSYLRTNPNYGKPQTGVDGR